MKVYERYEDMSPLGRLRLIEQPDGDMIVCIIPDPNEDKFLKLFPSAEFCTIQGGGQSQNVLKALRNLRDAIEKDNKEKPQHRGE